MKIRNVVSTLICFTVVSSIPFMVAAQETPGRDWEKERVVVAKLEAISPESVTGFESATQALDSGDWERAAIEYRVSNAMTPTAPSRGPRKTSGPVTDGLSPLQVSIGTSHSRLLPLSWSPSQVPSSTVSL